MKKKVPVYNDAWDLNTVPQPRKITKEPELITITRGTIQEDTKITVEKSKSQNNMNSGAGNGKFVGCENLQPTKFCRLRKFCSPTPFLSFALCIAALSSSWLLHD